MKYYIKHIFYVLRKFGFKELSLRVFNKFRKFIKNEYGKIRLRFFYKKKGENVIINPYQKPELEFTTHTRTADIIICVHNALEDVKRCIESVEENTSQPYRIVLVDDGSGEETASYLRTVAERNEVLLLRSEEGTGYTYAANWGLRASTGEYVVLLNSDTIVTEGWIDRMIMCAEREERIGIVGPLSNTASWQSIPEIEENGDWAENRLPEGVSVAEMGRLVAKYSGRVYPEMPLLNGFCLLIKREVIEEIGIFDEERFGRGYGEENDYALRARKAGWGLALADDTYVYHAQSKSYSHEQRKVLSERAGKELAAKHGQRIIDEGVEFCKKSRNLNGIRATSKFMFQREFYINLGKEHFKNHSLLFILPLENAGGGGNIVISEASAMQKMGVNVAIFNLTRNQTKFERAYPNLPFPVFYGLESDLSKVAKNFDAVVATFHTTVKWMENLKGLFPEIRRAYYIQDFEPMLYPNGSPGFFDAWNSYDLFPDLIRFTKTEWNRRIVFENIGVDCVVVGPSVEVDLFKPRKKEKLGATLKKVNVTAMVRTESHYRQPRLTVYILRKLKWLYKNNIDINFFGTTMDNPEYRKYPLNFKWKLYGLLNPHQVASLMNETDIFVDCSSHQAMGLTALEAMACGCAPIIPKVGGGESFARPNENAIMVNTLQSSEIFSSLSNLVDDGSKREYIQINGILTGQSCFPEKPAYKILETLFGNLL